MDWSKHTFGRGRIIKEKRLPEAVDLRPGCSPVVKQGTIGSCTADAIVAGLREYLLIKAGDPWLRLSRLFLYYEGRRIKGTVNKDSGAAILDGLRVLKEIGVCPEVDMPYDESKYDQPPTEKNMVEAGHYRIVKYFPVGSLEFLKATLAEGLPVVAGIKIYESFKGANVAKTGMVPLPQKGEQTFGVHAVLVVGYDDAKEWCIVRNSWGETWGDKGYCYVPYKFCRTGFVTEMWTGV